MFAITSGSLLIRPIACRSSYPIGPILTFSLKPKPALFLSTFKVIKSGGGGGQIGSNGEMGSKVAGGGGQIGLIKVVGLFLFLVQGEKCVCVCVCVWGDTLPPPPPHTHTFESELGGHGSCGPTQSRISLYKLLYKLLQAGSIDVDLF